MHRDHSILTLALQVLTLAGFVLLGIESGGAQVMQQSAGSDPFAAYHDRLNSVAERAVVTSSPSTVEARQSDSASIAMPTEPVNSGIIGSTAAIARVQQLRPVIEPILREEGVPVELAAIVLVESGGQPNALSPKGARGIWQFMPDTARRYGLMVSQERDERLDIQRSTRAAARYLRDLHGQFGDWQLAFAAYNAGGDLVQHAIARNHTSDFTFLSNGGALPLETRRYVPAVINAMQKVGTPSSFVAPPRNDKVTWILYAETKVATDQTEFLRETLGGANGKVH